VITINGVAFMGGVDVKRKPTMETSREARQQRLEARRQRLEARQQYHQDRHHYHQDRRDHRRAGELD
jgi:transposase